MNWMSILGLENFSARMRANLNEGVIAAEDRIALARLEWEAQKKRLQTILVLAIVLGGLTIVALVMLSVAILIQLWDSPQRVVVAWVLAGVWILAWLALGTILVSTLRKSSHPFALTRAELARDWSAIKETL